MGTGATGRVAQDSGRPSEPSPSGPLLTPGPREWPLGRLPTMSVVIGFEAVDPSSVLAGHPGFALAAITAGLARECGQVLVRDPIPDQPADALVVGRKTESVRRRFALEARWVKEPSVPSG